MQVLLFAVLFSALMAVAAGAASGTQSFEAGKFLDMLGRTFDTKVAYVDLLAELTQRMNLDINSTSANNSLAALKGPQRDASGSNQPACPGAPAVKGATVTYTSDVHVIGSRAFYECDTGFDGMSKFIYCTEGAQWSAIANWEGCTPVDCGLVIPTVQNADATVTSTAYGSLAFYACRSGYKMDKPSANISCLGTGFWDKPTFACEKAISPSLRLPSLQKAFNKNIGVQKIQQLQQLATTLLAVTPAPVIRPQPQPQYQPQPPPQYQPQPPPQFQLQPGPQFQPQPQPPPQYQPQPPPQFQLQPPPQLQPQPPPQFQTQPPPQLQPQPPQTNPPAPFAGNAMMEAFLKSMQAFHPAPQTHNTGQATNAAAAASASANLFANNPMAAMLAHMFAPQATTTQATTTTTTPTPSMSHFGFQLPSHLQSLFPNGLSSASGMKPQDLMTLAAMGLGSAVPAAAPKDITHLFGGMNPMSLFGGSMGLGGHGTTGAAASPSAAAAAPPVEPEVVAEQQEQMMMRAMMASAMKSMMAPPVARNGTAAPARNSAMDMMTLMALQNGLNGGSQSGGGSGGSAMDPMSMMMGLGGGGGGLLSSLFGA